MRHSSSPSGKNLTNPFVSNSAATASRRYVRSSHPRQTRFRNCTGESLPSTEKFKHGLWCKAGTPHRLIGSIGPLGPLYIPSIAETFHRWPGTFCGKILRRQVGSLGSRNRPDLSCRSALDVLLSETLVIDADSGAENGNEQCVGHGLGNDETRKFPKVGRSSSPTPRIDVGTPSASVIAFPLRDHRIASLRHQRRPPMPAHKFPTAQGGSCLYRL